MKDSFIILSANNLTSSFNNSPNYSPDRNNLYQQHQRNTFKNINNHSHSHVLAAAAAAQQHQQRQMSPNNTGGSTSQRYKTELCRPFMEYNHCKYDDKCQFAHGINELRNLSRHPKYKTELCKTFHSHGLCPYGHRCHFIHNNQGNNLNGGPPGMNNLHNNNSNNSSNHGNSNSGGVVGTNPPLIIGELGQNHVNMKHSNNNWSINYYTNYEDNPKVIGTSSSLSSDENLSLCSSPTSSDSSSSGSGPGTFSILPFDIVGQTGFSEQTTHKHSHHLHQEPEPDRILNMGQLEQHNITLEQFNNSNSRLPIFSSMLMRK